MNEWIKRDERSCYYNINEMRGFLKRSLFMGGFGCVCVYFIDANASRRRSTVLDIET